MRNSTKSVLTVLMAGGALMAISDQALAQGVEPSAAASTEQEAPESGGIEDIVVTAQRREERLQDVPISIQAYSESTLNQSGVSSAEQLVVLTPGLTMQRSGAGSTPFIRGVGTNAANGGAESPVTTYVDGVYYQSLYSSRASLKNVERVEVLKGPQGTLFGRNSTGGVIQIITRKPSSETSGSIDLTVATYDTVEANAYLTGGIADDVAADIAVYARKQGKGYGRNHFNGNDINYNDEVTGMGKIRYDNGTTVITVSGDYSYSDDPRGYNREIFPGTVGTGGSRTVAGYYNISHNKNSTNTTDSYGGSLTIEHDFGSVAINSITAYRQADTDAFIDNDFGPTNANSAGWHFYDKTFTQELRVASNNSTSINWIAGLFYLKSSGGNAFTDIFSQDVQIRHIAGGVKTQSIAGFGEVNFELSENDRITVGGRYTVDSRDSSGEFGADNANFIVLPKQHAKFSEPTWRLVYDHKFSPDVMAYISYNRGFKSGNYSLTPPTSPAFRPEYLDAYEFGFKSSFLGNRVRLNGAAFYYDYRDLQVNASLQTGVITVNAASATVKGIELNLNATPTRGFNFDAAISLLDTKYNDFPNAQSLIPRTVTPFGNISVPNGQDASGYPLVRTPDFTASAGVSYEIETGIGIFTPTARLYYSGKYNWDTFGRVYQNAYALLNLGIGWTDDDERWSARLQASNVTGSHYAISGGSTDAASYYVAGSPRVFSLTIGRKF